MVHMKEDSHLDSSDSEVESAEDTETNDKSLTKAYLWLIFGGFFGAHHFYLGQDIQGIVTMTTVGGIYGIGLLLDLFYLPIYMEKTTKHSYWTELNNLQMKHFPKPRFCVWLLMTQMSIGTFYRSMVWGAIPHPECDMLAIPCLPLASALGVWFIGRVFNRNSSLPTTLLGSYLAHLSFHTFLSIPIKHYPFDTSLGAALAYFFSSKHTYTPHSKISTNRKKLIMLAFISVLSLQGAHYYFNATVNIDGEPVKLRHVMVEFFDSPAWVDTKLAARQFYEEVWHIGILAAIGRLIDKDMSTMSEEAAYIILDVPENITLKELKKHFRNMSLIYHPDKHPEETREEANTKFLEIKLAFETVTKVRKFRARLESAKILKEFAERIDKRMKKGKKKEEEKQKEKKDEL